MKVLSSLLILSVVGITLGTSPVKADERCSGNLPPQHRAQCDFNRNQFSDEQVSRFCAQVVGIPYASDNFSHEEFLQFKSCKAKFGF